MTAPAVLPPDPEFATYLEHLGMVALMEGDIEMAGYLWDSADQWDAPSEGAFAIRFMALDMALRKTACPECGLTGEHAPGCFHAGGRVP